jgi:hypothetical protein
MVGETPGLLHTWPPLRAFGDEVPGVVHESISVRRQTGVLPEARKKSPPSW